MIQTCTHAPESGFDLFQPPPFEEIQAMAATLNVVLTQEAYDLLMAIEDPIKEITESE